MTKMSGAVNLVFKHKDPLQSLTKTEQVLTTVPGVRLAFSANLFLTLSTDEQIQAFMAATEKFLSENNIKFVFADKQVQRYLKNSGELLVSDNFDAVDVYPDNSIVLYADAVKGLPLVADLRAEGKTAFDWEDVATVFPEIVPSHAWVQVEKNIYPIQIPKPKFDQGLDMILIDCPSRNLSMMPNGLGYVHNALKKLDINHAVYDLDIIAYHRFHMHRMFNLGDNNELPSGRSLPKDPWQAEHYDIWGEEEITDYMLPLIMDIVDKVCEAKPKLIGMSLQQCNTQISTAVAREIKSRLPETKIIVGGFSCYNPNIGFKAFPLADYMCIGEADLTVGELVNSLVKGEEIVDMPGVLSKQDTPFRLFVPAPMENDLDKLEDPRYEWFPLSIYRNWDGYQLTPVIASRGCRWSRCTFCAERFYWRIRDPKKFVDELEYLVSQGCHLFMFNESDLNGSPETVLEICDEIIRRGLRIKLTAQLRIHKKSDRAFFEKLAAAGFVALRFGVDAFSENTLKLQKKGYTKDTVRQNLRDCFECGIYTEVNWVIGVPGETEEDCREGVEFILENKKYIGRIANINPLILVNGSVYWIDPESHGIRFNGDKDEILQENDRYVPSSKWYSIDPHIDADVRKERFEGIIVSLMDGGFVLGPWAQKIYDQVKNRLDKARA